MQVMLVSHAVIFTNVLTNTKLSSSSSIGKHFRDKHSFVPKDLTKNFSVLMKCANKFDCLVYEMFFINELKLTLNVQSDSIRA